MLDLDFDLVPQFRPRVGAPKFAPVNGPRSDMHLGRARGPWLPYRAAQPLHAARSPGAPHLPNLVSRSLSATPTVAMAGSGLGLAGSSMAWVRTRTMPKPRAAPCPAAARPLLAFAPRAMAPCTRPDGHRHSTHTTPPLRPDLHHWRWPSDRPPAMFWTAGSPSSSPSLSGTLPFVLGLPLPLSLPLSPLFFAATRMSGMHRIASHRTRGFQTGPSHILGPSLR